MLVRILDELARDVQMLIGVGMSTMLAVIDDPKADYFELFDAGLAQLEAGLKL